MLGSDLEANRLSKPLVSLIETDQADVQSKLKDLQAQTAALKEEVKAMFGSGEFWVEARTIARQSG